MRRLVVALPLALLGAACAADGSGGAESNPFLDDQTNDGKFDTEYQNPDGVEVEVDLEGDVKGPQYKLDDGPALLGQFATTYYRRQEVMFIESLAEDASSDGRAEWLVGSDWVAGKDLPDGAHPTHWRLRGVNTVMLFENGVNTNAKLGKQFLVKVPQNPFTVFADAGDTCADDDDHIGLDQSIYWYRWDPDQTRCTIPMQELKIVVTKVQPTTLGARYPEYDKLMADGKLTAVVLFGQIDDGAISDRDPGMVGMRRFGRNLLAAGYTKTDAPVGERYETTVNHIKVQIDLYSPRDFAGLDDDAHFDNFQTAISEHEIVVWDGHSMLGASDYWSRPTYPDGYQIFLYGGCLGYEYYVQAILHGKGDSWANVDIMSSVIEVSASANEFAAPAIAKIVWGLNHGRKVSWRSILIKVRDAVGDSTFGVSGVRENCFTPTGNRCSN